LIQIAVVKSSLWKVKRRQSSLIGLGLVSPVLHRLLLSQLLQNLKFIMPDTKPDVSGVTSFEKGSLKKIETKEKNTLPTQDTIEAEKKAAS
ncbi:thymosin beta, partial [Salmonella sp. s51944]|uniref:thymosin beta n=1 Tax=Salmonella sp. s51944 TaxID=3159655 RepID=UPI00398104BC